jgi:large subunit ribosomal protein L25
LTLKVNGQDKQVLIKDVQFDHLGSSPLHVDFARVDLTERITVSVPLEFRGTAAGTVEGGVLEHNLVDLEVECVVTEIPESIRVNVAALKIGDNLHVRELELPAGVIAVTPAEAIVASVRSKVAELDAAAPTEEGAEAQQPEIIGRKEKEKEAEEKE